MQRVMVVCHRYEPPWNEGEQNIVRALVHGLPAYGFEAVPFAKTRQAAQAPVRHRLRITPLLRNLYFWARAARVARRDGVAMLHVITSLSSALGLKSFALRRLSGKPVLLHVTGVTRPTRGYRRLLTADAMAVGGAFLRRFLPDAVEVAPISPNVNQNGTPCAVAPGHLPRRLLFLGAMEPVRGVDTLVEAMALLPTPLREEVSLTIAWNGTGDATYAEGIKQRIGALGLEPRVQWQGVVDDLGALYRGHDIVVIPRRWEERMAFPLRLVEAMSYGRPVVVSDVADLPAVAEGCGRVFERDHPESLAIELRALMEDPHAYGACAAAALERAKLYDPARTIGRFAEMYGRMIAHG